MLLTVAISSHGQKELCAQLIKSLKAQPEFAQVEVLTGDTTRGEPLSHVRNDLYRRARGHFVYFIDEDGELPRPDFLGQMLDRLAAGEVAVGGGYLDAEDGPWQRAYNSLVNFWLHLHSGRGQPLPVAGNFALPNIDPGRPDFPFRHKHPFGGEEIGLAENMRAVGLRFYFHPELSVIHHGRKSLRTFIARARLHGRGAFQPVPTEQALWYLWHWIRREAGWLTGLRMVLYLIVVRAARWK